MSSYPYPQGYNSPPPTGPPFSASTAPAPPPKPYRDSTTPIHNAGPPLPPTPSGAPRQGPPEQPSQQPLPSPPDPAEHWLPEVLLDKTTAQLTPLISPPSSSQSEPHPLLSHLASTHPSLTPSPLHPHLSQTISLSQHVQARHAHLLHLRSQTQRQLLHCHSLERAWREKQSEMDRELEPWSAKELYRRLVKGEREAEEVSRAVEESFLEERGDSVEREVGDMVRRFREGRIVVARRREGRQRWDEGRVGGWR